MARGPTLASIKKKAYWTAKEEERGRQQAIIEAWKKKPLDLKLKEIADTRLFQNIDVVEWAAIAGGTVIVHEVIFKLNEFLAPLKNLVLDLPINTLIGMWKAIFGIQTGAEWTQETLQNLVDSFGAGKNDNIFLWLAAFCISYFTVKHGGELLGVAKMFFGIL